MQTFLPYPNFTMSAECLDSKRLGKQRIEAMQILTALINPAYGWQSHPAVKMWHGYERALADYGICICAEWISRGYKDACMDRIVELGSSFGFYPTLPTWLTAEFCSNHRSILLAKNPEWYGQFGWKEQPATRNEKGQWPYLWR